MKTGFFLQITVFAMQLGCDYCVIRCQLHPNQVPIIV